MAEADLEGGAGAMLAFAAGLRPILVRGEVPAFRRYLGRWDEVLGDTTALAGQSDAEVRRTMAEMLRRPRQFGLPSWPGSGQDAPDREPPGGAPVGETTAPATAVGREAQAVSGPGSSGVPDEGEAGPSSVAGGAAVATAPDDPGMVDFTGVGALPLPGIDPVDMPASVFDEVARLDGIDHGRGRVREVPAAWRQADFVTGGMVEPRRRVPRVMPSSKGAASRRAGPRVPPGFRQLDLPFGGSGG